MINLFVVLVIISCLITPITAYCSSVTADLIVVLKSYRLMFLMNQGEIIKTYRISLGKDPVGHKTKEGDKKTPEGLYFIESRKSDSKYYKALKISYPNDADRQRAQSMGFSPGGMIMIHGLPKELETVGKMHRRLDWTDGCIGVTNEEIDEIWNLVPDGIPIYIKP
ncbi:MAG: L,D-transpeptidase family protein [Thermodesulfovibrionales bacterium]|nr:L,D-transpeptidase family protein [Thermodesulfovibrionales bacterium]